jgi:SAM-dependent methyltransferase
MHDPIHSTALKGFSEGALSYASGRPEYPTAVLQWVRDKLRLGPGKRAVDLGAGTGKFTQILVQSDAEVTAIEPVDAMRAQLCKDLPNVSAVSGTAQAMPLESGSIAAVVCAQAFHWFATREALGEIHRVLASGGTLGLVWNVRDESVDWVRKIRGVIQPYEGDTPSFYTGLWRQAFSGDLFSELEETEFAYEHMGSAQRVIIDRSMSVSFVAALPASEKAEIAARLRSIIDTTPALKGRATIAFPYRTRLYSCVRLNGRPRAQ